MDPRMPLSRGTRGQIVIYLRRGEATVNEIASALELTDNAIRPHLAHLERDGIVEQRGWRRGLGAPSLVYGLKQMADSLFSRAYALVLNQILEVSTERISPADLQALLRETGRRLGAGKAASHLTFDERIKTAAATLAELGASVTIEETPESIYLKGDGCPLAAVVRNHPEACALAEALLEEIIGVSVKERCDRAARPCCQFEVRLKNGAS